jgi:hypothetical protein
MPRAARTSKVMVTCRLPWDVFREAAVRSKTKGWSLSRYITWCVMRELRQATSSNPNRYTSQDLEQILDELEPSGAVES